MSVRAFEVCGKIKKKKKKKRGKAENGPAGSDTLSPSGFWGNLPGQGVNVGQDGRRRVNHPFDRASYRLSCCPAAEAETPRIRRGPSKGHPSALNGRLDSTRLQIGAA